MYGLIGAAIGAISQNFNTSESIAANKQEQQSNRDYNLNLAKMQNQWNREQWEREAQYNSPAAYRARLEAAGMNPDLAYGNVNGTAPASPGMTSGEPSLPVDYSAIAGRQTIGSAVSQALANEQAQANISLTQAQKNKTDEEAGKVSEETKGVRIDNLTRGASNTLSQIINTNAFRFFRSLSGFLIRFVLLCLRQSYICLGLLIRQNLGNSRANSLLSG